MTKNQRRKRKQQQAVQTYKTATRNKDEWRVIQASVDYIELGNRIARSFV